MALIQWIEQNRPGRLGVMARPGKSDSPENDLREASQEGVDIVISLLSPEDVAKYKLEGEPEIAEQCGLDFKSFPIQDRQTPPANAATLAFLRARLKDLEKGKDVVFHCSSGRGRTGLMAASLLVLQGIDPDKAMKRVRGRRLTPVPDTHEQMEWVRDLARRQGMTVPEPKPFDPKLVAAAVVAVAAVSWLGWRKFKRT
jgi:protein-tyrosine phosphatase